MYKKVSIALFIDFISVIPSIYYGLYLKFWWFDILQHFLGGFFIAMLFGIYLKDHLIPGKNLKNMLILVGSGVFIGVVWEFSEYIANQILSPFIYDHFHVRVDFMGNLLEICCTVSSQVSTV